MKWVIHMLPTTRSHEAYLQFVKQQLVTHYGDSWIFLQDFSADLIFWVIPIDLSRTASVMKDGYSVKTKGRKPRDPADMLRSTLLMTKLQSNVDDWVYQLRTIPIYAILSRFSPDDVPGVGTFYDFFRRLWNADSPHKTGRNKRKLKKPKKKGKKNEKQEPKNPGITEKLVARAMRSDAIHYSPKVHDRLMALFQQMFVLPSAEKGLLGNTASFSVIGVQARVCRSGRRLGMG
jgi:hypothetical protein